jgi:hypothetical protein
MKRPYYLTACFFLAISLFLTAWLFSPPFTSSAQFPAPTPVKDVSDGSLPFDTSEPITAGVGIDFTSSMDAPLCTIPPMNWEIQQPMETAAFGIAAASDGRFIYAAGGYGVAYVNLLRRYDPFMDQWSVLSILPTSVRDAFATYASGKLFIMGGESSDGVVDTVQIYDLSTGDWSMGTPMPDVRHQMGGGYYDGRTYIVGGHTTVSVSPQNQMWEYSIASDSWAVKANLPASLGGPGSGIVNGYLYILGGRDTDHAALDTAYRYNITGNSWSAVANLLEAVNFPGSVVYHDRIWLFGGGVPFLEDASQTLKAVTSTSTTQVYDPVTNTWDYGPMQNVGRSFQVGAVVSNQVISIGGWESSSASQVVEVLTQNRLKILIIYADGHHIPHQLRSNLKHQPGVLQVDVFDGESDTPSLSQLQNYNMVISFSNSLFSDATILGDVLADYQDGGGIVVGFAFDWYLGIAIGGRWVSGGYSPFNLTSSTVFQTALLGPYTENHPIMAGVISLSAYYRLQTSLASGAVQVAAWDDGQPLIAFKGRAVEINAYIGDYADNWSGDFARVIINIGNWLWLGNKSCDALVCPCSTLIQGTITDTDAVQTGRLQCIDPPGTCALPQTCEINDLTYDRHYDAFSFVNNEINSQCVTVTLDPGNCYAADDWLQSSAYLGSFNPASLCANYLADIGGSPLRSKSYSFIVPAWQVFTVVVNEVNANTYCPGYSLKVTADDCSFKFLNLPLMIK